MHRLLLSLLVLLSLSLPLARPTVVRAEGIEDGLMIRATDWPWWRGTYRNGTAEPNQSPPIEFGEETKVLWKSEVPGRGYGSPIVFGDHVFLASGDDERGAQSMLCYQRFTGQRLWQVVVHESGGMQKNKKSSLASSTPATDGRRVFINFPNDGRLYTTALDIDGNQLWQVKVSDYEMHQGYGASPAIYRQLVIVSADNKGGGALAGLNRQTGEVVWRRERPELPNYPSPILMHVEGRDQLVMVGCDMVVSYDPLTGQTLWETEGATTECVTSTLTDGVSIFTSGGYPRNHMSAIRADGSGRLVWENDNRLYVPSLVIHEGYLYGVLDAGIAVCWRASDGREMWKARLGGTFSSSPVLVNDLVYVSNEAGELFVYRGSPDGFERLAKNQLGDHVIATPAICDNCIFHRVTKIDDEGSGQEFLYCLGQPKSTR